MQSERSTLRASGVCFVRTHTHVCMRVCAGVCACSNVCRDEGGVGVWLWGGGVAAEAAGRTPASLLAPGAPLLSK